MYNFASQAALGQQDLCSKKTETIRPKKLLSFEHKQELRKAFCLKLTKSSYGAVAQKYLHDLEAEHELLLQELYALANITSAEFLQRFADYYHYFSQQESIAYREIDFSSIRVFEQSEREHIDAVIDRAGIDTKCIAFACHTSIQERYTFVAAFNTIFIDTSKIPVNSALYKALIGHELTHVMFDDWVVANVMNFYCGKQQSDFINKYNQFCEKRADIIGCLLLSSSAYVLSCYFAQQPLSHVPTTHPTNQARSAYLYKLSCDIKQELLKVAAA